MLAAVGGIMQLVGLALTGAGVVVGAEEFVHDAIRGCQVRELEEDVMQACTAVARHGKIVNIVVVEQ